MTMMRDLKEFVQERDDALMMLLNQSCYIK